MTGWSLTATCTNVRTKGRNPGSERGSKNFEPRAPEILAFPLTISYLRPWSRLLFLDLRSWGQLHTSKQNYHRIMTIASKALHQIKRNWGSPGYNIEHYILDSCYFLLSSSTYLRSCAVHMICTRGNIFICGTFHETHEELSFFFWNKTETKM